MNWAVLEVDANETRFSYENPEIKMIYDTFLDHPLSTKSKELLHVPSEER